MEKVLIKSKKNCFIKSYASSIFIKSIEKNKDIYTGCVCNMDDFQNVKLIPGDIVYYNKNDINGIIIEESTGNELHTIFHYKIFGIEKEKEKEKKRKELPMSFDGCEI